MAQQPAWLREPLGPDVDPDVRWLPFVTYRQATLDLVFSTAVPSGYGHDYGAEAVYLWVDILQPDGWNAAQSGKVFAAMSAQPV